MIKVQRQSVCSWLSFFVGINRGEFVMDSWKNHDIKFRSEKHGESSKIKGFMA